MYNAKTIAELSRIGHELTPLSYDLTKIAQKLAASNRACISSELTNILLRIERSTIDLRAITSRVVGTPCYQLKESLISTHEISIVKEKKWIKISLPAVVPGLKRHGTPKYLLRPLRDKMSEFSREKGRVRYAKCVIVLEHEYDTSMGPPRYIDYDNIEVKGIIDVLTAHFLVDDTSKNISVHMTAKASTRDRTNLYIMDPKSFHYWVELNY